jgi:serine/threonine protein kinase
VPHVLRGVYRFDQRIGSGGMGVVYRATDLALKRPVAIKTLPRMNPAHAAQLTREAQAMASINHPNLATIYGIETWRETPFLVEEFMAAGTLLDRLRGGPLPIGDVVRLGCALADVLAYLHRSGIVHCDVKPSNIGFTQGDMPKLLDFGVAYLLRDVADALASTTTSGGGKEIELRTCVTDRGAVGTPPYMSPEAARGEPPTPLVDLWSLAVALFEALAGERPYAGRSLEQVMVNVAASQRRDLLQLRPDCPPAITSFFDAALSRDVRQRPQTAGDLKARLSVLHSAGI